MRSNLTYWLVWGQLITAWIVLTLRIEAVIDTWYVLPGCNYLAVAFT
jgi:hypothetical protein